MTSAVNCITGSVCYVITLDDIFSLLYYWLSVLRHHSKWHLQSTQRLFTTLPQIQSRTAPVTHSSNWPHVQCGKSQLWRKAGRYLQWLVFCFEGRIVSALRVRRLSVTVKSMFHVDRSRPRLVIADSSECAASGWLWARVWVVTGRCRVLPDSAQHNRQISTPRVGSSTVDYDRWMKGALQMEHFSLKMLSAEGLWGWLLYWRHWTIC